MKKLAASGAAAAVLAALGFSLKSVLIKAAYAYDLDAMTLLLMRLFIAVPFFMGAFVFDLARNSFRITRREIVLYILLGGIGTSGAMYFSFASLETLDASLSVLIVYTYPALILIMLIPFNGRPDGSRLFSTFLTFAGLGLIFFKGDLNFQGSGIGIGIALAFASAVCYAGYNVFFERHLKHVSPLRSASAVMIVPTIFLGIPFGYRSYPGDMEPWILAACMAIFAGFIPFILYMQAVRKLGASTTGIINSSGPVFTFVWAGIFLGETRTGRELLGAAVVLAGVLTLRWKPRESALRFRKLAGLFQINGKKLLANPAEALVKKKRF